MKINKSIGEAKWYKYKGNVEFLIRRFPITDTKTSIYDHQGKSIGETFCSCIVDWKGLTDEVGKDLVCNEKNKLILCNYYIDVVAFVNKIIRKLEEELTEKEDKEVKN